MAELVVFCGLQATGKSTFYQLRFAQTHLLVSKDRMPNARHRDARQLALVSEALAEGRCVVVDNTNPRLEDRAPLIALSHAAGARVVCYWFGADVGASLARNRNRTGKPRVPDVAIFATRKRLVPPTYPEGFDALSVVRLLGAGAFAVERLPQPRAEHNPPCPPDV